MPLIPESVIDEIQARVDIAEVIGRSLPLKRAGRHFKANCPFHKERTPSFMINTEKQIFHCFGCGAGGNVFGFLMQHDRLTFPEAVRQLAEHLGITLPEQPVTADSSHARLLALTEKICRYFEKTLQSAAGSGCQAYLKKRGVSEAAIRNFRLGLSPAGWDHLLNAATTAGVAAEGLEEAGLLVRGKSGTQYDRFRNRLIFPIFDVRGRVIGFGGRSMDGKEPKYLNSPETALYSKGRQLFGLFQAKEAIASAKTAVVVEGYFDCVVLVDGGIQNVVSPLGTALTAEQAHLLKRYADRVILAFDADAAGEQATLRGIDILVEQGLSVFVARLPEGLDPDEHLLKVGRENFEQLLQQSVGIFEFLIQLALQGGSTKTAEGRVAAARFVLPTLAKIPDAMLRSEYVQQLAQRLHLNEEAVLEELGKIQPRLTIEENRQVHEPLSAKQQSDMRGPEALLVALVLDSPQRWQTAQEELSVDDITDPSLRPIIRLIDEQIRQTQDLTTAQIVSRLTQEGQAAVVVALFQLVEPIQSPEEAFADCLKRIKRKAIQSLRDEKLRALRFEQEAGNTDNAQRLLVEYQQLIAQSRGG